MHMPIREFVIYVDDIPDGKGKVNDEQGIGLDNEWEVNEEQGIGLDNEGEVYEEQGVGLDNEGEVNNGKGKGKLEEKGRKKGRGKGKSDGKGKGKSEEKGKEKSYEKGKGKSEEEGGQGENDSGLEDFSDEDYNMEEDNEDESDDALFDKYVCKDKSVVNDSESRESSSDEDVVVADGDFDEYKDSDSEHNGIRYLVFNPVVMFDKPEFELGMIFSNRVDFKKAVQSHAIAAKRSMEFTKVAPERVYARCKDKECGWKLTIIKLSGEKTYQVRDYQPNHTCAPEFKVANVKSKWLSEKFIRKFVAYPKRNTHAFRKDVMHELGCDVSKHQAIRAKRLALKKLEGCPDSQFSMLWDYAEEIKRTNPDSTVIVGSVEDDNGDTRFNSFYICLDAVKKGFVACRPLIGVDGCHLKGPHKGILLTAVGVDGNNCIYPLAWAVVNTESRKTWEWFLICLKHDLGIDRPYQYTFMSDKKKGLIQAFGEVFPDSQNRFYVRHLHGNFKSAGFRGLAYKEALWKAANASTEGEWKQRMEEMKELNYSAWEWLSAKPADQWSKSHFSEHPKCDMLLNNICESWNSSILEARESPILVMLEWIREWLMVRFQRNREVAAAKWKGRICPKVRKILDKHIIWSATCIPIKCDHFNYQVRVHDGTQVCVDLDEHTCSCRMWELSGIPCKHACSAIIHTRANIEDYVSDWYSVEVYKRSYAPSIKGINEANLWKESGFIPPLPPNMGRGKGRPSRARRNEPDEQQRKTKNKGKGRRPSTTMKRRQCTLTCANYGGEGHNKKSCGRERKRKHQETEPAGGSRRTMLPPVPVSQEPLSEMLEASQFLLLLH
ncbi:hypothetical protein ACS0TY_013927 [Phlomoides rotata]